MQYIWRTLHCCSSVHHITFALIKSSYFHGRLVSVLRTLRPNKVSHEAGPFDHVPTSLVSPNGFPTTKKTAPKTMHVYTRRSHSLCLLRLTNRKQPATPLLLPIHQPLPQRPSDGAPNRRPCRERLQSLLPSTHPVALYCALKRLLGWVYSMPGISG